MPMPMPMLMLMDAQTARTLFSYNRWANRLLLEAAEELPREELGRDLEAVMAVMAPRGPVVLVGHSMGGMTVLSHARQFPQRYPTRVVGVALISTAVEGVARSPLGEVLKNPALEAARLAARYAPKTVHRTRGVTRSVIGPVLRAASYGDAKVSPSGVMIAHEKSSVSLTNVECAVRTSVYAILSAAATQ